MMSIVVTDTSPVRALEHLGQLDLLQRFFSEVLVPPAVASELKNPASSLKAIDPDAIPYFKVVAAQDQHTVQQLRAALDPGESEAIALAIERHARALLIDEARGRRVAKLRGLHVVGVLGILQQAKAAGLVSSIRPLTDRLQQELKFRIAPALLKRVLQAAGE